MGNLILNIVLVLVVPISILMIFVEKKSRFILLGLICGALECFASYYVNSALSTSLEVSQRYYAVMIVPIVEELLKFIPVLAFGLLNHKNPKNLLPIAFAIGLGFGISENFYYLVSFSSTASTLWIVGRCVGAGLMHGVSTSIMALGIILSFKDKRLTWVGIICSTFISVNYHGLFNLLISNEKLYFIGAIIPIATCILLIAFLWKDEIKKFVLDKGTR